MDYAYATYNIVPPIKFPLWWEPFYNRSTQISKDMVARFIAANRKLCIFYDHEFPYIPDTLLWYIWSKYDEVSIGDITMFVARDDPALNAFRATYLR
jgi:hypothetical protein